MKKKKIIKYVIIGAIGIVIITFLYNGIFPSKPEYINEPDMEFTVKPYKQEIGGSLGAYLEIIEGTYTLNYPGFTNEPFHSMYFYLKLKMKVVKKFPKNKMIEEYDDRTVFIDRPDIKLDILDKSGMPINGLPQLTDQLEKDQLKGMLLEGKGEFIVNFSGSIYEKAYKKTLKDTVKIKTFQLNGELVSSGYKLKESANVDKSSDNNNSNTTNNTELETKNTENWDEILESYEEYIDEYIVFYKKAMDGDATAMSRYPQLMQKAQSFSNKLSNAGDELTPTQMAKFTKLQMKLVSAASGL